MKPLWLDRALFLSSHYFTLCTTEKLYRKALKQLKIKKRDRPDFLPSWHSDACCHYFENRGQKTKSVIVCLGDTGGKSKAQIAAMICHEAVHIWQQTKHDYGEHSPSSELEAYAIQSITQSLLEEFERQTR
jgi:hypothetical protein